MTSSIGASNVAADLPAALQTLLREGPGRWLVTGVAGFIGSHLLELLLSVDQEVTGLDNFSTGSRKNLDEVKSTVGAAAFGRFTLIEGDIRNAALCKEACRGVKYVLHQAALGSVPRSIEDPLTSNAVNVDGFLAMLIAARDAKVQRFVYASSSSVFGDSAENPKIEGKEGRPLSPYALTKVVNEMYAEVCSEVYGIEVIGLRYFNVFGPRQDANGAYAAVIPRWISALCGGTECVLFGDGTTTRDFCFIDNVVQANILAALTTSTLAVNTVYNIACAEEHSLTELYSALRDELAKQTGRQFPEAPRQLAFRAGDVRHSLADITRARTLLGYQPGILFLEGIERTVRWHLG